MHKKISLLGRSSAIFWTFVSVVCLLSNVTQAEQQAAAYMHATRYDMGGRVTGSIAPAVDGYFPATRNTYNNRGLLESAESGYLTDWQNETVSPVNWGGYFVVSSSTYYTYDDLGRVSIQSARAGSAGEKVTLTQFKYDTLSRVECKAIRMRADQFEYYASDWISACERGQDGDYGPDRITKYTYDKQGRVLTETRAMGVENVEQVYAIYDYDENGFRISVTDANNNKAEMVPDDYDRLYRWYFPSKTKGSLEINSEDYEEYHYDKNGNLTSLRKRDKKNVLAYKYDGLNRVIKKDLPDTTEKDIYYDYTHQGLQLYARFGSDDGDGVENQYNGFGELRYEIQHVNGESYPIENRYDENGNREYLIYPDKKQIQYVYDGQNKLSDLNANSTSILHQAYDDFARPNIQTVGLDSQAVSTTVGYDDLGRLSSYELDIGGSADDLIMTFSAYNPAGQLVRRSKNNSRYEYSGLGGQAGSYTADGLNQYTEINGKSVEHDENGNLKKNDSWQYTYDVENRLVTAGETQSINVLASLNYDPLGRLIEYKVNGSSTFFLYDGDSVIAELNGNGDISKRYVYASNMGTPVAQYTGSEIESDSLQFLHTNYQGSVIAVTGADTFVDYINTYDAYGVPGSGNMGRFAYTGQMMLAELGLYHYRARVYDPYIGRFLQTDPVGYEDQMNLYAYVGNDPGNFVDPFGMEATVTQGAFDMEQTVDCGGALVCVNEGKGPNSHGGGGSGGLGFSSGGFGGGGGSGSGSSSDRQISNPNDGTRFGWEPNAADGYVAARRQQWKESEDELKNISAMVALSPLLARYAKQALASELRKHFKFDPPQKDMGPHMHYGPKYPNSNHPKYHFGPKNTAFGRENFTWKKWFESGRPWRWK